MITVADVQDHARNNPFAKTCEVTDAEGKKEKCGSWRRHGKSPAPKNSGVV